MLDAANSSNQFIYSFYIIPGLHPVAEQHQPQHPPASQLEIRLRADHHLQQLHQAAHARPDANVDQFLFKSDVYDLGVPTYNVLGVLAGLKGITLNVTITNMNGFALVAIMNGVFASNLSLPTTSSLQQG
ncbi:unnamed protein product [Sphagnum jensenii]